MKQLDYEVLGNSQMKIINAVNRSLNELLTFAKSRIGKCGDEDCAGGSTRYLCPACTHVIEMIERVEGTK